MGISFIGITQLILLCVYINADETVDFDCTVHYVDPERLQYVPWFVRQYLNKYKECQATVVVDNLKIIRLKLSESDLREDGTCLLDTIKIIDRGKTNIFPCPLNFPSVYVSSSNKIDINYKTKQYTTEEINVDIKYEVSDDTTTTTKTTKMLTRNHVSKEFTDSSKTVTLLHDTSKKYFTKHIQMTTPQTVKTTTPEHTERKTAIPECKEYFVDKKGSKYVPDFVRKYMSKFQICSLELEVDDHFQIEILLEKMKLVNDEKCMVDYLIITEDGLSKTLKCPSQYLSSNYISKSNKVKIKYKTSTYKTQQIDFIFEYRAVKVVTTSNTPTRHVETFTTEIIQSHKSTVSATSNRETQSKLPKKTLTSASKSSISNSPVTSQSTMLPFETTTSIIFKSTSKMMVTSTLFTKKETTIQDKTKPTSARTTTKTEEIPSTKTTIDSTALKTITPKTQTKAKETTTANLKTTISIQSKAVTQVTITKPKQGIHTSATFSKMNTTIKTKSPTSTVKIPTTELNDKTNFSKAKVLFTKESTKTNLKKSTEETRPQSLQATTKTHLTTVTKESSPNRTAVTSLRTNSKMSSQMINSTVSTIFSNSTSNRTTESSSNMNTTVIVNVVSTTSTTSSGKIHAKTTELPMTNSITKVSSIPLTTNPNKKLFTSTVPSKIIATTGSTPNLSTSEKSQRPTTNGYSSRETHSPYNHISKPLESSTRRKKKTVFPQSPIARKSVSAKVKKKVVSDSIFMTMIFLGTIFFVIALIDILLYTQRYGFIYFLTKRKKKPARYINYGSVHKTVIQYTTL